MIGVFSKTTDSNFIEALGYAGMDFVILDQEHGPITGETLHNHVRAARSAGLKAFVRVRGVDPHAIGSALDAGADGVQVPNVSTAEQARQAVNAARFFPHGERGVCRFVKAADFGSKPKEDYFSESNKRSVILQVEGKEGIKNLQEILDVEGFDVLFIGPYDLSQSIGLPGETDHPKMVELIENVARQVKERNKTLGTFADTIQVARKLLGSGFDYLAYSVDVNIFLEASKELKNKLLNHQ